MTESAIEYHTGQMNAGQTEAPSPVLGPQIQRRLETMRLPEPYEEFEFVAWANAPAALWQKILTPQKGATDELVAAELQPLSMDDASEREINEAREQIMARQEATLMAALGKIIISHNGWVDYDGSTLPPPSQAAFYERIPTELLGAMIALMQEGQKKLGSSLRKKKRR